MLASFDVIHDSLLNIQKFKFKQMIIMVCTSQSQPTQVFSVGKMVIA